MILKGALLFVIYNAGRSRPTKDIDFLGASISNGADEVAKMIKEIIALDCGDGVTFVPESVETQDIMKDFYDILYFAENFQFEIESLRDAIFSTFENRNTKIEGRNLFSRKTLSKIQDFRVFGLHI